MPIKGSITEKLTYWIHLFQDNMSDLLASYSLSTLSEKLSDGAAQYKVYAFSGIYRVDVRTCSFWISNEIEHVSNESSDVTLKPHATQDLNKHNVSLKKGPCG